jgi:hypothetical protein
MGRASVKIGRNALCPCGSFLKYKKCCLSPTKITQNNLDDIKIENAKKAQIKRVKNLYDSDLLYVDADPGIVKISGIILELCKEYLDKVETDKRRESIISLTCMAWNLSFLEENDRKKEISTIASKLKIDFDIQASLREILTDLAQKKLKHYSLDNRYILDYQISDLGDNFHLNIIWSISEAAFAKNENLLTGIAKKLRMLFKRLV